MVDRGARLQHVDAADHVDEAAEAQLAMIWRASSATMNR